MTLMTMRKLTATTMGPLCIRSGRTRTKTRVKVQSTAAWCTLIERTVLTSSRKMSRKSTNLCLPLKVSDIQWHNMGGVSTVTWQHTWEVIRRYKCCPLTAFLYPQPPTLPTPLTARAHYSAIVWGCKMTAVAAVCSKRYSSVLKQFNPTCFLMAINAIFLLFREKYKVIPCALVI